MKRKWLEDWPWETVITINAGLCKEKHALHKPTSEGYEPAKKLWESSRNLELTLRETLDMFEAQKSWDEDLAGLLAMWKKEKSRMVCLL